jgi:serine protease Do
MVIFPIEAPPEEPQANKVEITGYNPFQGLLIGNLSPALADQIGKSLFLRGVIVLEVRQGSPGQKFGFQRHDIIKGLNGLNIKEVSQLRSMLAEKPDEWIISIDRGGRNLSVKVKR